MQPYSSTDTTTNFRFNLSVRSDFHMIDNLFIADHNVPMRALTSLSVDEILLPRYVNCSTGLRGLYIYIEYIVTKTAVLFGVSGSIVSEVLTAFEKENSELKPVELHLRN